MKRILFVAGALSVALALSACADLASGVISAASGLTTSTPTSVTTYADATLAADAATKVVDYAADNATTFHLTRATLVELQTLNDAVHAAWVPLQAANAAGQSLNYAAFNAALSAYISYKAAQGVPNAPS